MKLYRALSVLALVGLILSGCQLPNNHQPALKVNAGATAAARTLEAKLTQFLLPGQTVVPTLPVLPTEAPPTATDLPIPTAVIPTTTFTPAPTDTIPPPTEVCDAAQFIEDVTIPDGTILSAGEAFTKTWRLKNIGVCTWNSSYLLAFDVGDQMGGPMSIPLPESVAPGDEIELSVNLQAPAEAGSYRSYWRLRNPSGQLLTVKDGYKGKSFYVDIKVKNSASIAREFTVTGVEFKVVHSGSCSSGAYTVTASVRANGAGQVLYAWKRSDGVVDPLGRGRLTFSTAGVQAVSYVWNSGATGLSMILSIESPKPQDFGPALLNCV